VQAWYDSYAMRQTARQSDVKPYEATLIAGEREANRLLIMVVQIRWAL
jgi:hypothetical protein